MNYRHVALVPAREGSQGFKHKNRLFFENTSLFIDSLEWIDEVVVSTDDQVIVEQSQDQGYRIHERSPDLAGPAVSIKAVVENVVEEMDLDPKVVIWLFYLPILYKNRDDFDISKQVIEQDKVGSLCTFIRAKTHPLNCWKYDLESEELTQYIPNDVFRRQDLPAAWMHYHYVCCFKVSRLAELNNELLCSKTYPMFLSTNTSDQLIEIDSPEDYRKWKKCTGQEDEQI